MQTLLDKIRFYAGLHGQSISEVAKSAGVSTAALYRWDRVSPSIDKAAAVAHALGVTTSDLVGDKALGRPQPVDLKDYLDKPGPMLVYGRQVLDELDRAALRHWFRDDTPTAQASRASKQPQQPLH